MTTLYISYIITCLFFYNLAFYGLEPPQMIQPFEIIKAIYFSFNFQAISSQPAFSADPIVTFP